MVKNNFFNQSTPSFATLVLISLIFTILLSCEEKANYMETPVSCPVEDIIIPRPTGGTQGIELVLGGECIFEINPDRSGPELNFWRWDRQYPNGYVELEFRIDAQGQTSDFIPITYNPYYSTYTHLRNRIDAWHYKGNCFYGIIRMRFNASARTNKVTIDDTHLQIRDGFEECDLLKGSLHHIHINQYYVTTGEPIAD